MSDINADKLETANAVNISWSKKLRIYFLVLSTLWVAALALLLVKGYHGSFLYLNKFNSPFWDAVMPHVTQLGDSLIVCSLVLIMCSKKNLTLTICTLFAVLGSGLILIILKQFVFADWHRPLTVLKDETSIHYIEGYVEYRRSFPSGHATTIGSSIPFLALFLKDRFRVVSAALAVATAALCYTRVYLGSHFLGDIIVGSMLGSLFVLIAVYWLYPILYKRIQLIPNGTRKKVMQTCIAVGTVSLAAGFLTKYIL